MNQSYEMVYILRPDLIEEQVQQEVNKYREFLSQYSLENLEVKIWGKRRLAYPIKRFQDGIYVQMNYQAAGKHVAPLERAMRLSDEVIRYLTIKLPKVSTTPTEEEIESVEPEAALA